MSLRKMSTAATETVTGIFLATQTVTDSAYYAGYNLRERTKREAEKRYAKNNVKRIKDKVKLVEYAKKHGVDKKHIEVEPDFKI
jgi:hypothetical protein